MANRQKGYGLTAQTRNKIDGKYDEDLALEAMQWIKQICPDANIDGTEREADQLHDKLKNGVVLCQLANALAEHTGGKKFKYNDSKMAFKMMENIGKFLEFCDTFGCLKTDLFQTVDLYERQNMPQVVVGIHALGRKAQSKGIMGIGPMESIENKREFTEEQMKAGQGVIGLQMGSNKGASQAGQNFGKTRAIID